MKMKYPVSTILVIVLYLGLYIQANGQVYLSTRLLTRGADTAELYLSCRWYYDSNGILWNGLFHSTDNGKSLTLKRKTEWFVEGGFIFGDSLQGCIYKEPLCHQDTFGISFDYGVTFEKRFFNDILYFTAGCMAGEIYIQGWGLYRSNDFGNTFTFQASDDSLRLREVGTLPGELYCYKAYCEHGPLGLAYSYDYGQTFSVSYIEFPGVPVFNECMIYRGTEPGEIYFVIWYDWMNIYLFHTFDYGQTITLQSQLPSALEEDLYTAGRTPGTFYVVQRELCGNPYYPHSCLYIYFSRDYGVTFTEYYHFLDSTYTEIPSISTQSKTVICYPNPVKDNLIVELPHNNGEIEIQLFDLTGQLQSATRIAPNQDKSVIDVSALKPGIYLLKVMEGKKVIGVEKVVVE